MSVIPKSVSDKINMVAVTEGGFRLYFSAGNTDCRIPNGLALLHVRYPPRFTSNANKAIVDSVKHVHLAHTLRGKY